MTKIKKETVLLKKKMLSAFLGICFYFFAISIVLVLCGVVAYLAPFIYLDPVKVFQNSSYYYIYIIISATILCIFGYAYWSIINFFYELKNDYLIGKQPFLEILNTKYEQSQIYDFLKKHIVLRTNKILRRLSKPLPPEAISRNLMLKMQVWQEEQRLKDLGWDSEVMNHAFRH